MGQHRPVQPALVPAVQPGRAARSGSWLGSWPDGGRQMQNARPCSWMLGTPFDPMLDITVLHLQAASLTQRLGMGQDGTPPQADSNTSCSTNTITGELLCRPDTGHAWCVLQAPAP